MDINLSQEKLSTTEWWLVLLFSISQPILALIVLYLVWRESHPDKWKSALKIIVTTLIVELGIILGIILLVFLAGLLMGR